MWQWLAWVRQGAMRGESLTGSGPLTVGGVAMAGVTAVAWLAGLTPVQALAVGLVSSPVGIVAASILANRTRPVRAEPPVIIAVTPAGSFDPEEVIHQDANSGRRWRLGEVYYLGAAEKRRLEVERPLVWQAYRARLFPDAAPPAPID